MKGFFVALLLVPMTLSAQYAVRGKVVNKNDNTPVEMAAIRLFAYTGTADSTLVQGVQADLDGAFVLSRVKPGKYSLLISSMGFLPHRQILTVSGKSDIALAPIRLAEDVKVLEAVDVKGHAAEMTVKGDTIEYNTAAYKIQEGAMVEDLLKKMNGIQVDKEGNVTVNGESVKGVRIDGKKFFGNDVQSATKNIPADMIDKIQVIDEKSDMAKLTGFEDDDTERIINLSLKANRKKGVFGNFGGGLGADLVTDDNRWFNYANPDFGATASERARHFFKNDFRYNANLFTNILLGESQTTIIGGANNTNEIRSGRGRGAFGQQNQGITWSENLGVNTNLDLTKRLRNPRPQASLLFGGDGQAVHSYNDSRSLSNKDSYSNGITYQNADSTSKQAWAWDTRIRLELEYQIDTLNKLIFKPTLNYTQSRYDEYSDYLYRRDGDTVNNGYQSRFSLQDEIGASLNTTYNHKFLRPGRSLTISLDLGLTDTKGRSETFAFDRLQTDTTVDQNIRSFQNSYSYGIKASYVEPVYGRNHFLEFVLSASGNNRSSEKNQYVGQTQQRIDSAYSSSFSNNFYNEALELNYRWLTQNSDLSVGFRVNPSQTRSRTTYLDTGVAHDTLVSVWNFSPNVNFKYKFGKKQFARISYRGTSVQPSISQMEPARNNSDAMSMTVGNLDLNPAFRHTLRAMFSMFNEESFVSLMGGVRGSLDKDALVSNSIYDETGKLYSQTVNARALPWNIGADFMFNLPFAKKMMQLHSRTSASYNQQLAYLSREHTAEEIAAWLNAGALPLGDESKTGNLQVAENLNIRFTHDIVDLGLSGDFSYSRSQNSLIRNSVSNVFSWTVKGDVEFHLPKNWTIAADCGYTDRYGYRLSDVSELILNASVSKAWKNASLKLSAFDLLNNRKNIRQVVGENYVQYQKFNTLPTYAMLTFTYKLNKMGDLKAKGMAGHIQEMIEQGGSASGPVPGMPPKGTPPMGPPPGM